MRRAIFTEDHDAFRDSVRQFIDRTARPRAEEMIREHSIPREVWLEAGRQGLLGLSIPEEYGGSSAQDYRFNAVLAEEQSRLSAAFSSCMGIHSDVCPPYLVAHGTEEQKQRWLPGIATGELIIAIAMTEPSGGSDLAALKTTAVRDGEDWVINGSKTFITNGHSCDLVIVAARTDPTAGAKGITLFVLEAGTQGFTKGEPLDKVGQDEADTCELFFTDVRVSDEHRLGSEGRGFILMMEHLTQERVGAAVSNVAHAAQILSETLDYVKERKAFGQAIGAFQHNKFLLAELVTKIDVTQAFVDQCVLAHGEGDLTPVDAAKAKWWSAHVQGEVLDACVQLYGGYGFMNEYRVARAWRDARVTRIWAGSNEIMKEIIGRDLGLG
ncbi:acyl-CoA dehydrogenase family protein [Ornithinimicrobium cryptoxanthini]|uniref:Acyl-CoA dehydrogenase family protein n=1 Tax=Ornithinimicrobium cryptoxanthini TaxID=2934161 RepID=A0ABY4YID3_9MICO|nr:acyl-CoA dehydrogenase family protein [Ornithinimicrobium cryptoxanthini]USQ76558.1 acyl-CoA dehydrogenase family protein [Ornithinimicrobium cryptoxanthini]